MTTNPLEGVLSADQIDALVTAAEDLGEGRNGVEELLSRMTRAVLERALETEMSDHLVYESGDPAGQCQVRLSYRRWKSPAVYAS